MHVLSSHRWIPVDMSLVIAGFIYLFITPVSLRQSEVWLHAAALASQRPYMIMEGVWDGYKTEETFLT